jgi:hypothetical protein
MQVVAVRITSFDDSKDGEVDRFQLGMLAVHFMSSRVVVPLVDCAPDMQEQALQETTNFMHNTWPVHTTTDEVLKVCLR